MESAKVHSNIMSYGQKRHYNFAKKPGEAPLPSELKSLAPTPFNTFA